jgi:hypothetical protein
MQGRVFALRKEFAPRRTAADERNWSFAIGGAPWRCHRARCAQVPRLSLMRKTTLLGLLFALCSATALHGQHLRGYGLKAGAVQSHITWNYTYAAIFAPGDRWGLIVSGFVEFLDNRYFTLFGEVQYAQEGIIGSGPVRTTFQPEGTGEFLAARPRVDYLSLPIGAKVRFPVEAVAPYLLVGPRIDFKLGTNQEGSEIFNEFHSFDFGLTLGFGFEVGPLDGILLLAELRYAPNLTQSFDNEFVSVKRRSVDLLLGIRL